MELSGKIIAALEPRGGVSQRTGNTWKSQEFVIETHEQYPKHCVFRVFGEDRLRDFDLKVNEEVTVSFDIDAHEYQGRWYNDITVWRVQRGVVDAGAPAARCLCSRSCSSTCPHGSSRRFFVRSRRYR